MKVKEFKYRQVAHYLIFIGYLPFMILIASVLGSDLLLYAFVVWSGIWFVNGWKLSNYICPNCNKKYYQTAKSNYNVWALECRNCNKQVCEKKED